MKPHLLNYGIEILRLIREINSFNLDHPNVTKFIESFFTSSNKFVIVTELAELDLQRFREANDLDAE